MDKDPNSRGNTRGCRGIVQYGDKILAANYHSVQIFDSELNHIRDLSHDLFVGLHEIFLDDQELWVTSTTIDAVCCIEINNESLVNSYWPREMERISRHFGLEPGRIDKSIDNRLLYLSTDHLDHPSHTHINAVAIFENRVLGLIPRQGAIVDLTNDSVVVESPDIVGSHNLFVDASGRMYVNQTLHQCVRIFDCSSGESIEHLDLNTSPEIRGLRRRFWPPYQTKRMLSRIGFNLAHFGRPLFLRGLARFEDRLLVGMSPAAIAEVDLESGQVCDFFQYSSNVNVCIHGLSIVQDPPVKTSDSTPHHDQAVG